MSDDPLNLDTGLPARIAADAAVLAPLTLSVARWLPSSGTAASQTIMKPQRVQNGTERYVRQQACPTCGESPCRSPHFCRACRDADARKARSAKPYYVDASLWREPPDDLCALLNRSVSLQRAWAELNQRHRSDAPPATVEALVFSLRDGIAALGRSTALRRLSELSAAQLREVAVRVQKFKPEIAQPWKPEHVEVLIAARIRIHG